MGLLLSKRLVQHLSVLRWNLQEIFQRIHDHQPTAWNRMGTGKLPRSQMTMSRNRRSGNSWPAEPGIPGMTSF